MRTAEHDRDGSGRQCDAHRYSYTYYADGQPYQVYEDSTTIPVATYDYYDSGLRYHLTLANNVKVTYGYDTLNRLTDIGQQIVPQNPIASYHYKLDYVGNRTAVTEANGNVTQWGYDNAYRLTSETRCTPPQPPPSILVPNTAPTFVPGAAPTSQPPSTNGLMDLAPGTAQPAMYVANAPAMQSGSTTTTNYTYDLVGNRVS